MYIVTISPSNTILKQLGGNSFAVPPSIKRDDICGIELIIEGGDNQKSKDIFFMNKNNPQIPQKWKEGDNKKYQIFVSRTGCFIFKIHLRYYIYLNIKIFSSAIMFCA